MGERAVDFLIVGSGIAGASLAYALTQAGAMDVLVVDGETTGSYHASGRSAAMFMAGYGNSAVRALTRQSLDFFQAPPEGFAEAPLLHRRGHLTIADEPHVARLHGVAERTGAEIIDGAAAREMVPILRAEHIAAASYDPHAADIDTDLLYQSYARAARLGGARFRYDARFLGAERVGGGWIARVGSERIAARIIVSAAGAWADQVARSCGLAPIGLRPLRRTALLVSAPAYCDPRHWPMVMTAAESLYFKPDAGKLLVSPEDETPTSPRDVQPEEWDVAVAVDRLERVAEIVVRRVDHSWAGLRTFTADRAPVVGFDPRAPGFFWFAGQGGYGFQMAPALAATGAALLTGTGAAEATAEHPLITAERFEDARDSAAA
jgi:D-arginine dehydrogenase